MFWPNLSRSSNLTYTAQARARERRDADPHGRNVPHVRDVLPRVARRTFHGALYSYTCGPSAATYDPSAATYDLTTYALAAYSPSAYALAAYSPSADGPSTAVSDS